MSAGQKSRSVAVHWAPIIRDRAQYHAIEQRPIDIMILGCLNFFAQGSSTKQLESRIVPRNILSAFW